MLNDIAHTPGNAVYNVSHPLTNKILTQLELEAGSLHNVIPFDLRIAQMWMEGSKGHYDSVVLTSNRVIEYPESSIGLFRSWWSAPDSARAMKDSQVLANYAATPMPSRFIDKEAAIIHGASVYDEINKGLALAVSDWCLHYSESEERTETSCEKSSFLENFMAQLLFREKSLPFDEVVVMRPANTSRSNEVWARRLCQSTNVRCGSVSAFNLESWQDGTRQGLEFTVDGAQSFRIKIVERQKDDFMDLCEAPITSSMFMLTNTYFSLKKELSILITADGKPLAPYTRFDGPHCMEFEVPSCFLKTKHTPTTTSPARARIHTHTNS
jgi:hypothetical protein